MTYVKFITAALFIGMCFTAAFGQKTKTIDSLVLVNKTLTLKLQQTEHKFRILQSDYNRAKSQLKTLNKQIEGLKSDTARLAANAELQEQLYNECLDDVMGKMMDLQEIAFIVWGKKLRKVKRVKAVIDDKSCKQ